MNVKFWIIGIVAASVAIVCGIAYFDYQYPCVQYRAEWVEAYTETGFHYIGTGDMSVMVPYSIDHPAHWEQRCVVRGSRAAGEKRAPYAPIPAERSW